MCGYVQPNFEAVLYIALHSAFQFGDMLFFFSHNAVLIYLKHSEFYKPGK